MFYSYILLVFLVASSRATSDSWWRVEPGRGAKGNSQCQLNCNQVRARMCGNTVCTNGVIREEIRNCDLPDPCAGATLRQVTPQPQNFGECNGKCDRAIEKVKLECESNPTCHVFQDRYCTDQSGCVGQWGQWGQYEACNEDGTQTRERGCYLATDSSRISIYCDNSGGEYTQTETTDCVENADTLCQTETVNGRRIELPRVKQCQCLCAKIDDILQSETLYEKCEIPKRIEGLQPNASCNSIRQLQVSCEGAVESRHCSKAIGNFLCNEYKPWGTWGDWRKRGPSDQKYRQRHRWCTTNLHPFSNDLNCQHPLRIEEQCKTVSDMSPVKQSGFNIWLIVLIVVLFVILILVIVICLCMKRRKNRQKKKKKDGAKGLELKEDSNDVFEEDNGRPLPSIKTNSKKDEKNFKQLTVLQRFQRVSEHLYESVSGKSPSTEDLSSGAGKSRAARESRGNEYTLTNERETVKEQRSETLQVQKRSKAVNASNPLRISVTVTDPEGVQVGKSVYKPKLKQSGYTKKPTSQIEENKKRWSRVPTPQATSETKFFPEETMSGPRKERVHVPSVKYGSALSIKRPNSPKSSNSDRYGLRKFLVKLRKPIGGKKSPKHQYDAVPKEDIVGTSKTDTTVYYPHKISVFDSLNEEEEDQITDGEFDKDDDEFPLPPLNVRNESISSRQKHKRHRSRKKQIASHNPPKIQLPQGGMDELPPPPPDMLTPNTDVRSPMRHRWSDQSIQNFDNRTASKTTLTVSQTQSLRKNGYLDMTVASEEQLSPTPSWMQLGSPPSPGSPSNQLRPVILSSEDGSPQREVDPKYVTVNPIMTNAKLQFKGDLPMDRHGYLQLAFKTPK